MASVNRGGYRREDMSTMVEGAQTERLGRTVRFHASSQRLGHAIGEIRGATKFHCRTQVYLCSHLHKYFDTKVDPAQSTICPSCRHPEVEETETPLYQCPQRLPLVGDLFNKLQKFHEQEHTHAQPSRIHFSPL
jgi:hypothetical protein